ncbi:MAG: hypothetical protein F6K01_12820 [Okeania sp. SIO1I7]|nr:hypothetical protein [Okeania sp. SIO1I7]
MGRWGATPNPSQEWEILKDLAMALVMEHFFIPNPRGFDISGEVLDICTLEKIFL